MLKMVTKQEFTGDPQPQKRKRTTSLLEFGFVPWNDNPPPTLIRHSASLESKLAEEMYHDIVNYIVD